MNRVRLSLRRATPPEISAGDGSIIRRFFTLIERLERPFRKSGPHPAPEIKARITRLDDTGSRNL